jgi:glutamine amidotransferase
MIGIIDSKTANIGSLVNIFKRLNIPARLVQTPKELDGVKRILLPGVGHFDTCARNLRNAGFVNALEDIVLHENGLPLLGICVGAQLLTRGSEEGNEPGLGLIKATTHRFPLLNIDDYKIPHMGWNVAQPLRPHPLFDTDRDLMPRFYFVHSYYILCDQREDAVATTKHGIEFDSVIGTRNIAGVQFHPEKSHRFGMSLLSAFAAWNPNIETGSC